MQQQGRGLETLGTILAIAGWVVVAIAGSFTLLAIAEPPGAPSYPNFAILLAFASAAISGMALAGLGHLLRAVAQLGRNVHRIGMIVHEQPRPPSE